MSIGTGPGVAGIDYRIDLPAAAAAVAVVDQTFPLSLYWSKRESRPHQIILPVPAGYLKQLAWLQTFPLNLQIIPLLHHSAFVAVAEVDRINLLRLEVRY
jgi:hypothetical protein